MSVTEVTKMEKTGSLLEVFGAPVSLVCHVEVTERTLWNRGQEINRWWVMSSFLYHGRDSVFYSLGESVFYVFNVHTNHLGTLSIFSPWFCRSRISVSDKLPGDVNNAGPWPRLLLLSIACESCQPYTFLDSTLNCLNQNLHLTCSPGDFYAQ